MRILHLADTHLGPHLAAWGQSPGWHRSQDHDAAFARALDPALREEVDLVVLAGDLFDHHHPHPALVASTVELLGTVAARVPVVVIPGNHDVSRLAEVIRMPPTGLHLVDRPGRLHIGGLALALVPWNRDLDAWRLQAAQAVGGGADVLVAHFTIHGARVPGYTFRAGFSKGTLAVEDLPPNVRYVMGGHLHPRQVVRAGDVVVVYPGSTERTAFSERVEDKGVVIWEWASEPEFRFVSHDTRPMCWIECRADLGRVQPGTLVSISRRVPLDYEAVFHEALRRGGWVVGPRPGDLLRRPPRQARQTRLFPRSSEES